jgi:uncharacterized protein DUF6817
MSAEQAVRAWLRDRGAETIDHPGGTLYAHLGRVHDRLGALGHDEPTRLAGLAHAAYGTDGFDVRLLESNDRPVLRDLVGERAEALIFLYGGCDRSRSWQSLPQTLQVWNRFTGEAQPLPLRDVQSFVDLSIINEVDVMEQDSSIGQRYGDYFRTLFDTWAPLASPEALAAARQALAPF